MKENHVAFLSISSHFATFQSIRVEKTLQIATYVKASLSERASSHNSYFLPHNI